MSTDLQNLLANAQKLVDEGRLPEAIDEYRRAAELAPRESRVLLRLGDLYLRSGDRVAARATYEQVAELYLSDGIHLKAAAVYKQILKLAPDDIAAHVALAAAYLALGLEAEAVSTLDSAVQICLRDGKREEAIAPLEKLTEIRPEDVRRLVQLAEALSATDRIKDAAGVFARAAAILKSEGRTGDYIKVAERLLFHQPDDSATARDLAAAYLDEGDQKRALARLQLCFKADPRDTETLKLLARAFLGLGQREKAISVYREVAAIHEAAGRAEAQLEAMEEILKHAPDDEIAREHVTRHRPAPPSVRPSVPPTPPSMPPPAPLSVRPPASIAPPSEPIAQAERYLNEGAYLSIIDLLEPIVEANEEHIEARRLLLQAYEALGQGDEAVDQLLALAEYHSFDDPDAAEGYLLRVLEIDPENIEAKLQLKGTSPGAVIASIIPPALNERLQEEIQEEIQEAAPSELEIFQSELQDELGLAEGSLAAPAVPKITIPPPSQDPFEKAYEDEAGALFDEPQNARENALEEALEETEESPIAPDGSADPFALEGASEERAPAESRDEDQAEDELIESFDVDLDIELLEPISPEEFEAMPITEPPEPLAAVDTPSEDQSEIEEVLEEAEFYVSQGLLGEARETLIEGLEEFAAHPLLSERLEELEQEITDQANQEEGVADEPESPAQEDADDALDATFALASKLAEEAPATANVQAASDALDAKDIFEQFKEGVAREIDEEDSATHFDLGIAYREMGLHDDAIREFELAARAPLRACNALTMIGLCHIDAQRYDDAIRAFEEALDAPHKLDGEILGLHYEIGLAEALRGETGRAVEAFEKAASIDPSFRDVSARLGSLKAELS